MLIAFVALIAVLNGILGATQSALAWSWFPASIQDLLGPVLAPVAWLLGVPWQDATVVGNLLGTRIVLNEFISYAELATIKDTLGPDSFLIANYALCGFANLGSVGIQIGALGAMLPGPARRTCRDRLPGHDRGNALQLHDRRDRGPDRFHSAAESLNP